MKRLTFKKTENMTKGKRKDWAEKLKEAETHFIACANYCKTVKRLLKDIDACKSKMKHTEASKFIDIVCETLKNIKGSANYVRDEHKNIFRLLESADDKTIFRDAFSSNFK